LKSVLCIGHRGAGGYAPENTLKSIRKALELKVDMIEVDVHMCKTGEIVCFHDRKLNRQTNGKGYVHQKSLESLKRLDAGEGERISTLEEVLDCIDQKATLNIELKGKRVLNPVLRIVDRYVREKGWHYDNFLISTFTRSKLKKIAKVRSRVKIGALVRYRPTGFIRFAKSINAFSIHVNIKILNRRMLSEAQKAGLVVYAWTANTEDEIAHLKEMGVDGIFSDYPDRVN